MNLGFIGTGGITTAIVQGLCTAPAPPEQIWVSRRNETASAALAKTYSQVNVGATNQDVVDNNDMIVLAFLPHQKKEVLKGLAFRKGQIIIHILAGTPIKDVVSLVAPAGPVIRAVPLPCTALHTGPIAVCPPDKTVAGLFAPLGTVIELKQETELESLAIITALMAPYFDMLDKVSSWAENQGIGTNQACDYTIAMFKALSVIAENKGNQDLASLREECMTPGGLNELAMNVIDTQKGFQSITSALEAVRKKVE